MITDFEHSRLFGQAPENIVDILRNEAVTPNFHSFCITQQVIYLILYLLLLWYLNRILKKSSDASYYTNNFYVHLKKRNLKKDNESN